MFWLIVIAICVLALGVTDYLQKNDCESERVDIPSSECPRELSERELVDLKAELRRCQLQGLQARDQMDAAAARACELLGIDPESDSDDRDDANAIVYHNVSVDEVMARVLAGRSQ